MTKRRPFTAEDRKEADGPFMDNPEYLKTDKVSIYDMHEDMQTVDAIPLEDVRMEWEEEKEENRHKTKRRSSSEDRYRE